MKSVAGFGRQRMLLLLASVVLGACGNDREKVVTAPEPEPVTAAERATWGGARIYDEVCDRCHKMGVDGAPEVGDPSAWRPRVAKGRKTLLRHVYNGFNKMPARGDCEFCSDAQLAAALDYMLGQSH